MQVTASFGVAGLDDDGTLGHILRRADAALYEAKRHGATAVCLLTDWSDQAMRNYPA